MLGNVHYLPGLTIHDLAFPPHYSCTVPDHWHCPGINVFQHNSSTAVWLEYCFYSLYVFFLDLALHFWCLILSLSDISKCCCHPVVVGLSLISLLICLSLCWLECFSISKSLWWLLIQFLLYGLVCLYLVPLDVNHEHQVVIFAACFLHLVPNFHLLKYSCYGNLVTMKSSGDIDPPLEVPLLMFTSASLFPVFVNNVFQQGNTFLRKWWCSLLQRMYVSILSALSVVSFWRFSCSLSISCSVWFSSAHWSPLLFRWSVNDPPCFCNCFCNLSADRGMVFVPLDQWWIQGGGGGGGWPPPFSYAWRP